jgi:Cysteine dioxygenase type I
MLNDAAIARLGETGRALTAPECEALAREAAAFVDLETLDRSGPGAAQLLWRTPHSEAWLNTWWEARDTGFHDHDGSRVGVHVLAGRAANEALTVGVPRQVGWYGPGEGFSFIGAGIHRMDHAAGAVTIHVYSPPIRAIGHYELFDGALGRSPRSPDDESPPSPLLSAALSQT